MESRPESSSIGGVEILENKQKKLEKIRKEIGLLKKRLEEIQIEEERLQNKKVEISDEIMRKKKELKSEIRILGVKEHKTDQEIDEMETEAIRQIDALPKSKSFEEHSEEDQKTMKNVFKGLF